MGRRVARQQWRAAGFTPGYVFTFYVFIFKLLVDFQFWFDSKMLEQLSEIHFVFVNVKTDRPSSKRRFCAPPTRVIIATPSRLNP